MRLSDPTFLQWTSAGSGANMKKYENRSSAGPDGRAVAVLYWFKEVVDARPDIVAGWRPHNEMFRD